MKLNRFTYYMKNVVLLVLLALTSSLCAQKYKIRQYSVEQGLAQSQVFKVFQDKSGYLWFCNLGGASRFNGAEFENFSMREGLSSNLIINGFSDHEGTVWLCTNGNGFSRFKNGGFTNYKISDKPKDNEVRYMAELEDGKYLLGTIRNGIYLFDGETFEKYQFPPLNAKIDEHAYGLLDLKKGNDGTLWFGTSRGLISKKNDHYKFYGGELIGQKEGSELFISALAEGNDGSLIVGTKAGLIIIKGDEKTLYNVDNGLVSNNIGDIEVDRMGAIWVATREGASKLLNGKFTNFTLKSGLTSENIRDIHIDEEDNVWFATNGSGMNQLSTQMFNLTDSDDGLSGDIILNVNEDSKGRLWCGTYQNGLSVKEDGKFRKISTQFVKDPFVWGIAEDHNGVMWFATDGGLVKYDGVSWKTFGLKEGMPDLETRSICVDKNNVKWIGLADSSGLVRIENDRVEYLKEGSKGLDQVYSILEDAKGNIWFSSEKGGVGLYKDDQYFVFNKEDGLINVEILSITIDKFGNILAACNGGGISQIKFIDDVQLEISTILKVDQLADDGMISLFFDKKDFLWIGTNRTVEKFDYYKYLETGEIDVTHYGFEDGFIGIESIQNSIIEDSDSNILIGTISGLMAYDRDYDRINMVEPKLYISEIKMFFEEVDWTNFVDSSNIVEGLPQFLSLPYDKNHISFHYEGLSFQAPSKVKYQYKLVGLENKWSPELKSTELSVTYPNILPGEYTFMLRASNNDGVWNKEPLAFHFEVKPPFWQTSWFILLSIVVLILSAYLLIKWRFRTIQERSKLLELQVKERTRELRKEKELVESQNDILAFQRDEIETKSIELENAFSDITDSIKYAKKIQDAILSSKTYLKTGLGDYFILFKPKSIVSGDFYWVHEFPEEDKIMMAAADCTGHGVPGAFMSMIGNSLLNEIVIDKGILEVDVILNMMRERIISALSQTGEAGEARDGMDIALCLYDKKKKTVEFSGAFNPAYFVTNGELLETKGDPQPVGFFYEEQELFTKKVIDVKEGGMIYLFSDGYPDQFGGSRGKKFKYKRFKDLLITNSHLPMDEQRDILDQKLEEWKGNTERYGEPYDQIDDILIMGFKI